MYIGKLWMKLDSFLVLLDRLVIHVELEVHIADPVVLIRKLSATKGSIMFGSGWASCAATVKTSSALLNSPRSL